MPSDEDALIYTQGYGMADIRKHAKIPATVAPLLDYAEKRTLNWSPRTQGNIKYGFNVQAAVSFVVGESVDIPCYHCSKGSGAFTKCVM